MPALLIPPAHQALSLSHPAAISHRHRQKISPRDLKPALTHASLEAPGLQCDPARDLASGSPSQSCLPRGPCPPIPLDEIVCVSKFSIASARSTVTRTSTTPLAKRPSRHLPHNPLPPKWTLPSELRCWNAAPRKITSADMLRTGFPSSSSRSPAFSAAPVRSHDIERERYIRQEEGINTYTQAPAVA